MFPDNENTETAAPAEMRADRITRHYRKRGVPTSGRDTARLLLERYALKREAIRRFIEHLEATAGRPAYSDTQVLFDAGVTESEVEALVTAWKSGELAWA